MNTGKLDNPTDAQTGNDIDHAIVAMQDELRRIFAGDGTDLSKCESAMTIFRKLPVDRGGQLLGWLFDTFDLAASSDLPSDIRELALLYSETTDNLIKRWTQGDHETDVVYNNLYQGLTADFLYPNPKAQAFALYWMMLDKRLPYYRLAPGVQMQDEEYRARVDYNKSLVRRMRFVMSRSYQQRTEKASAILDTLKAAESDEDRAVLFSIVLAELERRAVAEALLRRSTAS